MYIFGENKYKSNVPSLPHFDKRMHFKPIYLPLNVSYVFIPVFDKVRIFNEVLYDIISLIWCSFRRDIDIIFLFGYAASPFVALPRLFGKKVYIMVDGREWKRAKWGWFPKKVLHICEWFTRIADYKVYDSCAIWEEHNREYGVHPSFYLPPTIDKFEFPSLDMIGDYYLVVARLEPENHIHDIIRGYKESSSPRRLVIVGDSANAKYKQKLRELAGPGIEFKGAIYGEQVRELRRHCFAYIHGHEVGGTNPSLIEAMSFGNLVMMNSNSYNYETTDGHAISFIDAWSVYTAIRHLENKISLEEYVDIRQALFDRAHDFSTEKVMKSYMEAFG